MRLQSSIHHVSLSISTIRVTRYEPHPKTRLANLPAQYKIYQEVFSKWPQQALRPDHQLQDVLAKAVNERYRKYQPSMEAEELSKAKALQFLVQDRYNDRVGSVGCVT